MEFFAYVKNNLSSKHLQRNITIESLSSYCASVDNVLEHNNEHGVIYCLWGEFVVSRECINGGVRFSLPGCPNNIAWSITAGHQADSKKTVIHLTMSREQHEADFIESINTFVADWKQGLSQLQ